MFQWDKRNSPFDRLIYWFEFSTILTEDTFWPWLFSKIDSSWLTTRERINTDTIGTNSKAFYQLQERFNKNKSTMNQTEMLSKEIFSIFHKI